MTEWLGQNIQIVSAFLNFGMLLIWIVYLQVFVSNYRRQTRAHILITTGSGTGLAARCLVSNMSSEPLYIHSIILWLETPQNVLRCSVTEIDGLEKWQEPSDLNLWTRQGPLSAGKVRDMGTLEVMLDHALRSRSDEDELTPSLREALQSISVQIIAVYGSEDLPVAAERRFSVLHEGHMLLLRPDTVEAQQIRSRRQRRAIKKMLEKDLRDIAS